MCRYYALISLSSAEKGSHLSNASHPPLWCERARVPLAIKPSDRSAIMVGSHTLTGAECYVQSIQNTGVYILARVGMCRAAQSDSVILSVGRKLYRKLSNQTEPGNLHFAKTRHLTAGRRGPAVEAVRSRGAEQSAGDVKCRDELASFVCADRTAGDITTEGPYVTFK